MAYVTKLVAYYIRVEDFLFCFNEIILQYSYYVVNDFLSCDIELTIFIKEILSFLNFPSIEPYKNTNKKEGIPPICSNYTHTLYEIITHVKINPTIVTNPLPVAQNKPAIPIANITRSIL